MNFQNLNFDYVESDLRPAHTLFAALGRPFNFETQSDGHLSDQSQSTAVEDSHHHNPFHLEQQFEQQSREHLAAAEPEAPGSLPPYSSIASRLPATPSPRPILFAPTPPYSSSDDTSDDLYGPDRLFGPPLLAHPSNPPPAFAAVGGGLSLPPTSSLQPPAPTSQRRDPRFVHFDEAQLEMAAREAALNQSMLTGFRDELTREAGVVTPGVDDTPYLQYALEAITKEPSDYAPHNSGESHSFPTAHPTYQRGAAAAPQARSHGKTGRSCVPQPPPQQQSRHVLPPTCGEKPAVGTSVLSPTKTDNTARGTVMHAVPVAPGGVEAVEPPQPRPASPAATLTPDPRINEDELPERRAWTPFEPWHRPHVLPLDYKPLLLRLPVLLAGACLALVLAALVAFCAIYSLQNTGLVDYSGTIYGGQWFVFRILPQLLALLATVFAQAVAGTAYRIQPFRMLASDMDEVRQGALVRDLNLKTWLLPKIEGSWDINIPVVLVWLAHFAIPLSSSLFSVVLMTGEGAHVGGGSEENEGEGGEEEEEEEEEGNGVWRWAVVQGVAWTVVALYVLLVAAFVVLVVAWRRAETGLLWDPRSLADMISLFSRSNNTATFDGLDGAASKSMFAYRLGASVDRLTWWHDRTQPRGGRWWYSLGLSGNAAPVRSSFPRKTKYVSSNETLRDEKGGAGDVKDWYLPWYLRTNQLLGFVVLAALVLTAIFVVSFVRRTALANGFLPGLDAAPNGSAFSAANFLWSFFPSFLGLVFWLLWMGLENRIRVLTPWAELSRPGGADARRSLLVDYAAAPLPLVVTVKAVKNGHWKVAATSLLSAIFSFLPVVGGGLFMALTRQSDGSVRMYPNFPAYGVLLAILVLYFLGLVSLLTDRQRMKLPHAVDSLGEVFSFTVAEEFLSDSAFRTAGDFDNRGQFTGREKRGMMVEELVKGKGEKRYVFQRENGRWGIFGMRKYTGGGGNGGMGGLGMARRMRSQMMRTRQLAQPEFWGRRGSELPMGAGGLDGRESHDYAAGRMV
ncbi:hypothetical protein MKZ38_000819 [Zalerion maritima]|uniref:Uncharacterized protein n=1 Tax=Zalerion maritima TaxID=339359 RepID=A0AAD5WTN1_9PEZI|nr:hypothetical protein MKZ38_000819 [Zalerion maritima]